MKNHDNGHVLPLVDTKELRLVVTLSSSESEYIALLALSRELVWVRNILNNLSMADLANRLIPVFTDSQVALKIASNPQATNCTSYVRKHYYYMK